MPTTTWARVAAGALVVAACTSGGDAEDSADPNRRTASPTVTVARLDLGALVPADALVPTDEIVFGSPRPDLAAGIEGYETDPLLDAALARTAYRPGSGRPLADVTVVAVIGEGFVDDEDLDEYVAGFARAEASAEAEAISIADQQAFVATAEETVISFRHENLVVVVRTPVPADATAVVASMRRAIATGADGTDALATPIDALAPDDAFVELGAAAFEPLPDEEDADVVDIPPGPGFAGLATFPEGRLVIVGNEVRAIAWSLAASTATYPTAEDLVPVMEQLAGGRAGDEPDLSIATVGDRTVWGGDGELSTRVFRHQNLVLIVDAFDPVQADAAVTAWIDVLDTAEAAD